MQRLNDLYTLLEVLLLRTGALLLLGIYVYKQIRKHWNEP